MNPQDLDTVLEILRKHGVASAEVPATWTGGAPLRVVFAPTVPDIGETPTPGGWKSPDKLDAAFNPDEVLT